MGSKQMALIFHGFGSVLLFACLPAYEHNNVWKKKTSKTPLPLGGKKREKLKRAKTHLSRAHAKGGT